MPVMKKMGLRNEDNESDGRQISTNNEETKQTEENDKRNIRSQSVASN